MRCILSRHQKIISAGIACVFVFAQISWANTRAALAPQQGDLRLYSYMLRALELQQLLEEIFSLILQGRTPPYNIILGVEQIFRKTDDALRVHFFEGAKGLIVHSLYSPQSSDRSFLYLSFDDDAALPPGLAELNPAQITRQAEVIPNHHYAKLFTYDERVEDWVLRHAYGSKGASLVKLRQLEERVGGYRVPDFELISIHAMQESKILPDQTFVLPSNVEKTLARFQEQPPFDYQTRFERLLAEYHAQPSFDNLAFYNLGYYQTRFERLREEFRNIIVRSSGSQEDSHQKSQAGLYLSERADPSSILHAIGLVLGDFLQKKKGAGSLYAGHAVPAEETLGIVVQQYVQPRVSGVVFSSYGGNTTIEAGPGKGPNARDSLTFGRSNTIIDLSKTGEIIEILSAHRENAADDNDFTNPPLVQDEINEIFRIANALEKIMGYAVDIEFAYKEKQLYLVQMRPVTASAELEQSPLPSFEPDRIIVKAPITINPVDINLRVVLSNHGRLPPLLDETSKLLGPFALLGFINDHIQYDPETFPVLIDTMNSFTLTHEGITLREMGEPAYFCATGSENRFREKLSFDPMPGAPNIFISRQRVRVISNGRRGIIVTAEEVFDESVLRPYRWPHGDFDKQTVQGSL